VSCPPPLNLLSTKGIGRLQRVRVALPKRGDRMRSPNSADSWPVTEDLARLAAPSLAPPLPRMNEHLAFLLSRVFDESLAPEHRADLAKSTLTETTIRAQFIRSVPPYLIPKLLGFDLRAIRSALLFPYRAPGGGFMDHVRMKIFPSLTDRQGHAIKYLQPKSSPPRLYFIRTCLSAVLETDQPLWLVEGEKKALAVAQLGPRPVIGFAGVEGWHMKGSRDLLPDFDALPLAGRIVELLPDGDFCSNANVERAIRRLGAALRARGAKPRVRLLPQRVSR